MVSPSITVDGEVRRFGRRDQFEDPRDYPLRAALGVAPAVLPRYNYWNYNYVPLDQGQTGTCVAHGGKNFLLADPIVQVTRDGPPAPYAMYREIVLLDEWSDNDWEANAPDEQLQSGTSSRALCTWLRNNGYIAEYRRARNIDDMAEWVALHGPLLMGVPWYEGMLNVDSRGYIVRNGAPLGGHFVIIVGVNFDRRDFTIENSWGRWGIAGTGRARISWMDMETIVFVEGGEAYAGLEVPLAVG